MPKVVKDRTPKNQQRIEAAALALFTTQGFHGTNNREIARRAGVSTGAIYNYYPSKEAIFAGLALKYQSMIHVWFRETVRTLADPFSKRDLTAFASAIWSKMCDEPEYLLLILIDVIEFKHQHFAAAFQGMPQHLRELLGPTLREVQKRPGWRGHDPAFVLAAVYHYFFHYALIEKHLRGGHHLGVSNEQAILRFVDLLSGGLQRSTRGEARKKAVASASQKVLDQTARERIEFIRLLCGRLWSSPPAMPPHHSGNKAQDETSRDQVTKVPMLFLPEIARDRPDENQLGIEAASLDLFTSQGFHGTNIRDIAEKAGISQGTIYTYYPGKEAIFESLVESYQSCMLGFIRRVMAILEDPFSRSDLRLLAGAVRSMVYDDDRYLLLMFIDALEFKNRHFANLFHDIPGQFRYLLGPRLTKVSRRPGWCGQDPAFVLATIYMFFFNYFVIERHMQGNQHLGPPEAEAIERLIDVLSTGLWQTPPDTPPGD